MEGKYQGHTERHSVVSIISIVSGLLSLANWFAERASRKQLINEGEKNAIHAFTKGSLEVLQRAKARHKRVSGMSDDELDGKL